MGELIEAGKPRDKFTQAIDLMKRHNVGAIGTDELLERLESILGEKGMDMLALWGIMMANEAVDSLWYVNKEEK